MKKLFCILFVLVSINLYANQIPGWLNIDLNYSQYHCFDGVEYVNNLAATEISLKYGAHLDFLRSDLKFVKPYLFFNLKTFMDYEDTHHFPFRDNYSTGVGFIVNDLIYFEYEHRCSHAVFSETDENRGVAFEYRDRHYVLFEGYPTVIYSMVKIGIKFKID